MEKRLTADLNVAANSNLEIQLLDGDLNIIQKLDDEPNDVGGLTSAELKAKFDESGNIIKKYINETLIPAVVADGATEEHRAEAEAARVAAEQTRQSNEETRQANEAKRQSAENARNVWENYDASKAYVVGNKVAYGGSSYLCIKPCTGIAPPSAEYWLLIAKKGDKGEPGGGGGQPAVEIDLYSAGVNVDVAQFGKYLPFEVSADIVTQLVTAAKTGGALLKFGFMTDGIPVPVQAYLMGSAIEIMQAYQFSGKVTMGANAINVFVVVQLQNSSTQVSTCCTVDQNLPLPETTNEGAFLRVKNGVWAAVQVPAAEEASF